MKITRLQAGSYLITGHIENELVQYEINKMASWWEVERTYGIGPQFTRLYGTLSEATDSIIELFDN